MNVTYSIVFDPPGAPQRACSIIDSCLDERDLKSLVDRGEIVVKHVDELHRVVLVRIDGFYVMYGFRGKHALNVDYTDEERLFAHWRGFCDNNEWHFRNAH